MNEADYSAGCCLKFEKSVPRVLLCYTFCQANCVNSLCINRFDD
ncbi:hypothetical protein HMPREF3156_02295 [Neisseria sp. HMSC06F02]|nr:hypothetical protein HMPREF3156_02295 [Neisseria sp. HMSC06F02]